MADKTIFTVGFQLPTDKFEYIPIESKRALADADIILIEAKLTSTEYDKCKLYSKHWIDEIRIAFQTGKTVLIYLPTRTKVKKAYATDIADSFDMIPIRNKYSKAKDGKKVNLTQDGKKLLTNYWKLVGTMSNYKLVLDFSAKPLLMANDNIATVGAYVTDEDDGGTMFFLPPIQVPEDFLNFTTWSDEANQFGHNLAKELIALDKIVKSTGEYSPEPDWLYEPEFILDKEEEYSIKIGEHYEAIRKLEDEIVSFEEELAKASIPKQLLYETGIPLEKAIIHGLRIIGFEADNFQDDESEFDIVFVSADEGRFLGESEGKDNKAIAVEKARQLEINIQEDFAKEGVEEYAKGVLFGNGYRVIEPCDRKDCFTTKVQTLAKRSGITLVGTDKLFEVVKYIQNTNDQDYAKAVRECFRDTEGKIIEFPPIPS